MNRSSHPVAVDLHHHRCHHHRYRASDDDGCAKISADLHRSPPLPKVRQIDGPAQAAAPLGWAWCRRCEAPAAQHRPTTQPMSHRWCHRTPGKQNVGGLGPHGIRAGGGGSRRRQGATTNCRRKRLRGSPRCSRRGEFDRPSVESFSVGPHVGRRTSAVATSSGPTAREGVMNLVMPATLRPATRTRSATNMTPSCYPPATTQPVTAPTQLGEGSAHTAHMHALHKPEERAIHD